MVLRNSQAKFKFVFIRQLLGGLDKAGRGGAEAAPFYEWGGHEKDGKDSFAANRPGWGKPVHKLLLETGVTAVFHGHDHFFAHQELDGIAYQLVPQSANRNLKRHQAEEYGYEKGDFLPNSGFILVNVSLEQVKIEYIRSVVDSVRTPGVSNGQSEYSYKRPLYPDTPQTVRNGSFVLLSSQVADGGTLPTEFTGDGNGSTLPLEWSGAPSGTKSYALIMHHIDPKGIAKWYWILYNIPAGVQSLPKNVKNIGTLGNNSVNERLEYAPPHSKGPGAKTYLYTVYALSAAPQISVSPEKVNREVLLATMKDKILASAELRVIYSRPEGSTEKADESRPGPPPQRARADDSNTGERQSNPPPRREAP
ncbi:MAG: YbhB/YbcL family Raf kinase inhibitor-like protein [Lentisphaerota bacterium]